MANQKSDHAAVVAEGRKAPQWTPTPPEVIETWLRGKSRQDLDALEQQGRVLYPDKIRRFNARKGAGHIEEADVLLRVPTTLEQVRSRIDALDLVAQRAKLGKRPTKEEAEALLGPIYFDNLDTVCLLSHCLLDAEARPDGTHPRYMLPEFLDEMHPRRSLLDIYERLNWYTAIEDPRLEELSEEQFVNTVAAIAKVGNLSPLLAIGGSAQDSFVTSMGRRLAGFLTP